MSTTLPKFEPVAMTDDDRDAVFNALPDRLSGFMKLWGWLHFAKDIEAKAHEKNADQLHAYGLAVWKAAIERAVEVANAHAALRSAIGGTPVVQAYTAGYCDAANIIADTLAALPLPEQGSPQ